MDILNWYSQNQFLGTLLLLILADLISELIGWLRPR